MILRLAKNLANAKKKILNLANNLANTKKKNRCLLKLEQAPKSFMI